MKKIHVTAIALLLGLSAVLGTFAATRSASLGTASRQSSKASYQVRVKQLDAYAAKLRHELAAQPAQRQALAGTPIAPRIVYRRPPAIVVVKHKSHADDGFENAAGGGGDD